MALLPDHQRNTLVQVASVLDELILSLERGRSVGSREDLPALRLMVAEVREMSDPDRCDRCCEREATHQCSHPSEGLYGMCDACDPVRP